MITIVITCDTEQERREAAEIDDWIRDGEFESEIDVQHVQGPS